MTSTTLPKIMISAYNLLLFRADNTMYPICTEINVITGGAEKVSTPSHGMLPLVYTRPDTLLQQILIWTASPRHGLALYNSSRRAYTAPCFIHWHSSRESIHLYHEISIFIGIMPCNYSQRPSSSEGQVFLRSHESMTNFHTI